jgi:hypothetical protein
LLTGRENLELIGLLYHLDKAVYRRRAQDALERMSLTGAGDDPAALARHVFLAITGHPAAPGDDAGQAPHPREAGR